MAGHQPEDVAMLASYAGAVFKVIPLLNGAAALGVMNYVGQAIADPTRQGVDVESLKCSVLLFGFGALAGSLVAGMSFLSQAGFMEGWFNNAGDWFRGLAVLLAIVGYSLFAAGLWVGVESLG